MRILMARLARRVEHWFTDPHQPEERQFGWVTEVSNASPKANLNVSYGNSLHRHR